MRTTVKISFKGLLIALPFLAILSVGVMFKISDVWAQEQGVTLAKQVQGTWTLVSIYNELDGKKNEQFGPTPKGTIVFTPDGRFAHIMMRASLPKFAANNRIKGTAEENQAVVQGSVASFGSYKVVMETNEPIVIMHYDGSTFPNWDGENHKRIMTVTGDELQIVTPAASIGGTNYAIWKRVN